MGRHRCRDVEAAADRPQQETSEAEEGAPVSTYALSASRLLRAVRASIDPARGILGWNNPAGGGQQVIGLSAGPGRQVWAASGTSPTPASAARTHAHRDCRRRVSSGADIPAWQRCVVPAG